MSKLPEGDGGDPRQTAGDLRRTLIWAVWIALIFLFLWYAWEVLFLAFAGLLLAIILRAAADWIEDHTRLGPHASYLALVLGLVVLVALSAFFIVPNVIAQTAQILRIIPESLEQAKDWLDRFKWGPHVVQVLHRAMENFNVGDKLAGLVSGALDAIAASIIVAVVGLYAAANPQAYARGLLRLVPEKHQDTTRELASDVIYTLRWWILGQLVPMVVLGIATMIGLSILGVPLAFTLGLFTGVMIFIPYLGALLSEIPAVLVGLSVSPMTAVYVLILYLGVHALEGYVLTPLVQRRAVRLLPIATILAQFLMWVLTGLLGVAIATPLVAAGWVIVKRLYLHERIRHTRGFGT